MSYFVVSVAGDADSDQLLRSNINIVALKVNAQTAGIKT